MSDERYSVAQSVDGLNRPLLDLRNNPDDAQRFVEAQKEMYDFVVGFVKQSISQNKIAIKVSLILKTHKIGFAFIDRNAV